ncbi:uncharacterized protein LOC143255077 isoform X3 [Tachypleus tridentatus]|uniref:uncharacterized protein LOC143255077 isoform X3 n=1 Tax=Tachypleus tridentatus TaxID=6853 RepID=UPI003FD36873
MCKCLKRIVKLFRGLQPELTTPKDTKIMISCSLKDGVGSTSVLERRNSLTPLKEKRLKLSLKGRKLHSEVTETFSSVLYPESSPKLWQQISSTNQFIESKERMKQSPLCDFTEQMKPVSSCVCEEDQNTAVSVAQNCHKQMPEMWEDIKENKCRIGPLFNLGNTCFLNSILYVLRLTPQFTKGLHSLVDEINKLKCQDGIREDPKWNIVVQLHQVFHQMKRYEDVETSDGDVTSFIKSHLQALLLLLRDYHPSLEENHQQDAHEALILVLNVLSEISDIVLPVRTISLVETSSQKVCRRKRRRRCIFSNPRKRKKKISGSYSSSINDHQVCERKQNFVRDLFQGRSSNTTVCLECEHIKCSEEEFCDLSVPVLANYTDDSEDEEADSGEARSKCFLTDTLKKESLLRGPNKYYCEECHHYVEARCGLVLNSTPQVLILQLGRFNCQTSFKEQVGMSKLNTHCPVPLQLPSFHKEDHCYCLFAVVIHKGLSVNSGHYVTVVSGSSYTKLSTAKEFSSIPHDTCCALNLSQHIDSTNIKPWFFCDDDKVQLISEKEVEMHLSSASPLGPTATPYLLFYQKLNLQ